MNDRDRLAFTKLFSAAHLKCFGCPIQTALTESDSKLFSDKIFEKTGLVIGWKSLKNYSQYFLQELPRKRENPSDATLDTLARYVLHAPRTDESTRKKDAYPYGYWRTYSDQFHPDPSIDHRQARAFAADDRSYTSRLTKRPMVLTLGALGVILAAGIVIMLWMKTASSTREETFTDTFTSIHDDSLRVRNWFVTSIDEEYWKRRSETPGALTLFTLKGDSWPDSSHAPQIRNMLLRKINGENFTVEIHFSDFIPTSNWEQAGIIVLEDTTFAGKSARLSIAYNDYYGGSPQSRDVLVQAITSLGQEFTKPEELAHHVLFRLDRDDSPIVTENMHHAALRIEKQEDTFRFLYSNGMMENSAFTEVVSRTLHMHPRFVGIFALRGFTVDSAASPVHITRFVMKAQPSIKE